MPRIRELVPGDEVVAEAFLASLPDTTMILRSNLERAGLTYGGALFEGTYVGAFEDDALVGVAAHYWNGNVLVAGRHIGELAQRVRASSGRDIAGVLGTHADVVEVRRALDIVKVSHDAKEILFSLDLAELVVPAALTTGVLVARTPDASEMAMLLEWRMAYAAETMGIADTPETRAKQAQLLGAFHADGEDVLLFDGGEPVAYSAFNAKVRDMVQVGGVWTPPPLRRRGYARSAVAASLLGMRDKGSKRAILFTGEDNVAAQKSYLRLGFREVGDYAILLGG